MSAFRLSPLLVSMWMLSGSLAAQEHVQATGSDAAHDAHTHAMQMMPQADEADLQTAVPSDAESAAAQDTMPAMEMAHAHMQHGDGTSSSTAHSHHDAAASLAPTDAPVLHRARTQESAVKPPADHGHVSHAGMEHGAMNHAPMKDAPVQQVQMDHTTMDHTQMHHDAPAHMPVQTQASAHSAALPREPIPAPTAEDIAAAFAPLHGHAMHGTAVNRYVLLDRLEAFDTDRGSGQQWEARAWIGGDINRLWLRSEGERQQGHTQDASVEAFYGHAISPWWDVLVGMRQEIGTDHRSWAAFGVQGLAPYKFETEATLFVGSGGRAALRLEGEYDVLLTNCLILQPRVEADIALRDDAQRGIDRGLEQLEAGVRLRYEITRRFAPYIGWVHQRSFGDRAQRATMDEEPARDSRFIAGVRIWF
ncbi:copper resistance protein B [Xanthomonas vesicatoria]|uniref:Copper resistance protein B n=2 Tax=Xanthomonas vesicatoria TaxID=56460 RepID=A0AAJ0N4A2_9XANT|nr:copper resistance protein B [Xanthomonas vesicatoria]APO95196.1 copper resistance protein CopB [Xanthomonas vesicatoria]KHM91473.1 copper resistance protein CopB [Xanthomonas vesicatoria]KHM93324.1 copper resistance protein CopB [Xanthomonas vesicatoria]MCC8624212.1 copper resistance protein B [Xanthomonas vesicatoria]MCC8696128.1 copper resistance protein B [Xanthomonas vesicatoria]